MVQRKSKISSGAVLHDLPQFFVEAPGCAQDMQSTAEFRANISAIRAQPFARGARYGVPSVGCDSAGSDLDFSS
jgi:hypothetical protein